MADPLEQYSDPSAADAAPAAQPEPAPLPRKGSTQAIPAPGITGLVGSLFRSAVSGDFLDPRRSRPGWVPPAVSNYVDRAVGNVRSDIEHAATHPEDIIGTGTLTGAVTRSGVGPLARYALPREPSPITGHNIGSLQMPRVPRNVDPETGLYSAADEAAHSFPVQPSRATVPGREDRGIIGTARAVQEWMQSQGVTANEMRHRGLDTLFADPRRSITRQELMQHLADNPVQLRSSRYQGTTPEEPRLQQAGRPEYGEEGIVAHPYRDEVSGRDFTIYEDRDAGNVSVQAEDGSWLPVPGRMNRQSLYDGRQAIIDHLGTPTVPSGARGPAQYGPDYDTSLSLNTVGNPTYAETVLYAPPAMRPPELRAHQEAVAAYERAQLHLQDRVQQEIRNNGGQPLRPSPAMAEFEAARQRVLATRPETVLGQRRPFIDSHYQDEPNPIGWVRGSRQQAYERNAGAPERTDTSNPLDVYNLDEVQMPMAQRIRDQGARNDSRIASLRQQVSDASGELDRVNENIGAFAQEHGGRDTGWGMLERGPLLRRLANAHPGDHPVGSRAAELLDDWQRTEATLGRLRRELTTAETAPTGNAFVNDPQQALRTTLHHFLASNPNLRDPNLRGLTLTPGAMQNERYNLARHVGGLRYNPEVRSLSYQEPPYRGDGNWRALPRATGVTPEALPDYVGADVARRLLAQPLRQGAHELTDLGALEVGGRGMRENYDRIYPETIDAIFGRLDPAYPGRRQVYLSSTPHEHWQTPASEYARSYYQEPVHYFPLTDRIRAQLARGLPYFTAAGVALPMLGREREGDPLERYDAPAD